MPDRESPAVDTRLVLKWWDYAACLAAAALSIVLLPLPLAAFAAALGALAVLIAIVDIDRFIIPDSAVLAVALLGLLLVAVEASGGRAAALADAVLRAATIGGALYLLRAVYRRRAGVHGLGLGDVKLAAAAGPWLMWPTLPFAVAVAAVAALLAAGARALLVRERVHLQQELPFGAFLAPAVWLSLLIERLWLTPA
jgi:leader peptidase (prepilin peptidase) / N-methyltransferase